MMAHPTNQAQHVGNNEPMRTWEKGKRKMVK